jgi:hypothetical protein
LAGKKVSRNPGEARVTIERCLDDALGFEPHALAEKVGPLVKLFAESKSHRVRAFAFGLFARPSVRVGEGIDKAELVFFALAALPRDDGLRHVALFVVLGISDVSRRFDGNLQLVGNVDPHSRGQSPRLFFLGQCLVSALLNLTPKPIGIAVGLLAAGQIINCPAIFATGAGFGGAAFGAFDFLRRVLLAGAGDELQGIKRGIMEMADAIVITKADSGNEKLAEKAKIQYRNALHLFPAKKSNWIPQTFTCSSIENKGLDEINHTIESYFNLIQNNGWLFENRKVQEMKRLDELLNEKMGVPNFEIKMIKKFKEMSLYISFILIIIIQKL